MQKKVQEELDSVVGQNRHPTISDRPNLPYTEVRSSVRMNIYFGPNRISNIIRLSQIVRIE